MKLKMKKMFLRKFALLICGGYFDKPSAFEAVTMASEKQWEQELLHMKKQQLLEEVLQQKMKLEAQLRQQVGVVFTSLVGACTVHIT